MTAFAIYLADLERTARAASIAEEEFRREAAARVEELKTDRCFAFRRMNLLRAIGKAVAACEDEDQAGSLAARRSCAKRDGAAIPRRRGRWQSNSPLW